MAGKVEFKKPGKSNVTDVSRRKVSGRREWPTMSNAAEGLNRIKRAYLMYSKKKKKNTNDFSNEFLKRGRGRSQNAEKSLECGKVETVTVNYSFQELDYKEKVTELFFKMGKDSVDLYARVERGSLKIDQHLCPNSNSCLLLH